MLVNGCHCKSLLCVERYGQRCQWSGVVPESFSEGLQVPKPLSFLAAQDDEEHAPGHNPASSTLACCVTSASVSASMDVEYVYGFWLNLRI